MKMTSPILPDFDSGTTESAEVFVAAMAHAATQVSVVTTDGPGGRFGVTISAFASVSAEPPLVLVCINRRCPAVDAIEANGHFCINSLAEGQSEIANCFAGRPGTFAPYDFTCGDWHSGKTGAPLLDRASATFDCAIEATSDAGTHRIFIGRVLSAHTSERPPLAFSKRAYQALRPLQQTERPHT